MVAIKYANIANEAVKNTTHDEDNRLETVAGGTELSFAFELCLTPVSIVFSTRGLAAITSAPDVSRERENVWQATYMKLLVKKKEDRTRLLGNLYEWFSQANLHGIASNRLNQAPHG